MAKNRELPRHILVLRLSAMGDAAMLPHALRAFKNAYPQVKVTVASRPAFEPFFRDTDTDFLPVDLKNRHRGIKGIIKLSDDIINMGIDALADEHDVLRSVILRTLLRMRGVKVAVIDKQRREKKRLARLHAAGAPFLKHTVIRYCDTLRKLGFGFPDPKPAVKKHRPDPLSDGTAATKVGFAPFSAHQGKTCPEPLRSQITELLSKRFDRVYIHSGGGSEADFAREMEQRYPNVTAVFGKTKGLGEEMDLISNLDCMISMDSMAMHIASLTATPVVSLWGATHPVFGFFGYGCDKEGMVRVGLDCSPCSVYGNKKCIYGDYRCLSSIKAEDVMEKVEKLMTHSKQTL